MGKTKVSQSEIDGVEYRRAKLWQIILYACNGLVGMSVYSLTSLATYSGSVGYGIATVTVGVILMSMRILDAVTDPILAFIYDRTNTRFGKIRILMIAGYLIEAVGLLCMFHFTSSKGFGIPVFILTYVVYVIGYTLTNMTAQTVPSLLTNDPKQRPVIGVWTTAFNYLVPMIISIVLASVILPMAGGTYNQTYLSIACFLCLAVAGIGTILVCIGVSSIDKPENFIGTQKKKEPLKIKDLAQVLKKNRPLQCYVLSAASDKLASQVASQSVVTTLLSGILIGNMSLATILSAVGMLPSIIFAAFGAKYAGKHGSQKSIVDWTKVSMFFAVLMLIFFIAIDPTTIADFGVNTLIYVLLTFAMNGSKMCVTTANTSFMSDIIDYEMDRSGKYIPAVVTGAYSLVDKLVSAASSLIATAAIALIGYTSTVPQVGDETTPALFAMTMFLFLGLPLIGWVCSLVAMRFCHLSREDMVEVQKRIAEKKELAMQETAKENA